MDFYSVLSSRRSIRSFKNQEVPDSAIQTVVGSAMAAPSAHNSQPARFILLRSDSRVGLIKAMSARFEEDLRSDGLSESQIRERVKRSESILLRAPVVLLVCLTMKDMQIYRDVARRRAEQIMAVQSTAAAVQNLLLSVHAEGLGACWMCAPLFCQRLVKKTLALPEDYEPQAFIVLGYPAENPTAPRRKPLEDIMQVL